MANDALLEWDRANVKHIARHGIAPVEVEQAFANDRVDIDFNVVDGEERWTVLGHTDALRVNCMTTKADRPKVPKFNSESHEAAWWDAHAGMVEEELIRAMRDGTARRGTAARLAQKARGSNPPELDSEVTIRLGLQQLPD